jgi:hypothetical protein
VVTPTATVAMRTREADHHGREPCAAALRLPCGLEAADLKTAADDVINLVALPRRLGDNLSREGQELPGRRRYSEDHRELSATALVSATGTTPPLPRRGTRPQPMPSIAVTQPALSWAIRPPAGLDTCQVHAAPEPVAP